MFILSWLEASSCLVLAALFVGSHNWKTRGRWRTCISNMSRIWRLWTLLDVLIPSWICPPVFFLLRWIIHFLWWTIHSLKKKKKRKNNESSYAISVVRKGICLCCCSAFLRGRKSPISISPARTPIVIITYLAGIRDYVFSPFLDLIFELFGIQMFERLNSRINRYLFKREATVHSRLFAMMISNGFLFHLHWLLLYNFGRGLIYSEEKELNANGEIHWLWQVSWKVEEMKFLVKLFQWFSFVRIFKSIVFDFDPINSHK